MHVLTLVLRYALDLAASGMYKRKYGSDILDIAQNLYYDRDFRRKYPQTEVITQQYLMELLLASPNEDGTKRYVFRGRTLIL